MIFTFIMNYFFIFIVRDYAFSLVVIVFWRVVCVVYYLGFNLFCYSDWRGKLVFVNDGGRSIFGSRYFIVGIFVIARI